jgi:hypothetical protein
MSGNHPQGELAEQANIFEKKGKGSLSFAKLDCSCQKHVHQVLATSAILLEGVGMWYVIEQPEASSVP